MYVSPVGLAKLVHPDGECAIAAACGKEGIIEVVNTVSSMPIEDIMAARVSNDQPVFWQLYVDKDLKKSEVSTLASPCSFLLLLIRTFRRS